MTASDTGIRATGCIIGNLSAAIRRSPLQSTAGYTGQPGIDGRSGPARLRLGVRLRGSRQVAYRDRRPAEVPGGVVPGRGRPVPLLPKPPPSFRRIAHAHRYASGALGADRTRKMTISPFLPDELICCREPMQCRPMEERRARRTRRNALHPAVLKIGEIVSGSEFAAALSSMSPACGGLHRTSGEHMPWQGWAMPRACERVQAYRL